MLPSKLHTFRTEPSLPIYHNPQHLSPKLENILSPALFHLGTPPKLHRNAPLHANLHKPRLLLVPLQDSPVKNGTIESHVQ